MTKFDLAHPSPSLMYNAVVSRSAVLAAANDSTTVRRFTPVAAAVLVSAASAQDTGTTQSALNVTAWTDSMFNSVTNVMNSAGPGLYKLLGMIGGFYFVWNRVRSLW